MDESVTVVAINPDGEIERVFTRDPVETILVAHSMKYPVAVIERDSEIDPCD